MVKIKERDLSLLLADGTQLRKVEPHIYSVFPETAFGNEYDSQFGFLYNLVACNPLYNRFIWGYSVKIFSQIADEALHSSQYGAMLDIGCGSLAFTAKIYGQQTDRPLILIDQSLKMLRMAKAKLIKLSGMVPKNLLFIHADARQLPFQNNSFTTILCQNLLHCLNNTDILLKQVKSILSDNCKMYFTTLVKANRVADKYLETLADSGKLVSRDVGNHQKVFEHVGLSMVYETIGNMLLIKGNNR